MDYLLCARWLLAIAGGYALGGVMFSWHISKLLLKVDICETGSDHNPGSSNVFAAGGWQLGVFCLLADMLKAFLPVFLASRLLDPGAWPFSLVMLAPVLGHATAPYYGFSGGKGIAPAFGALIALLPGSPVVLGLIFYYLLFSLVIRLRPVRVRSIVTFLIFALTAAIYCAIVREYAIGFGCALVSAVVAAKHTRWLSYVPPENEREDIKAI